MHFVDGHPVGMTEGWHRNGQKALEATMDASQTGHLSEWYENGQLKSERNLVNGKEDGLSTSWHPNGQKKSENNSMVEGRPRAGTRTEWYENGQMKSENLWINGQTRCSEQWDQAGNPEHQYGTGCGGVVETAESASIAVLPFISISGADDGEALAYRITDSIILELDNRDANVAPPEKSSTFKGSDADLREIAAALNVSYILEGSVQSAGDRLRITAQLIRVADGYHVWSRNFDLTMADLPGIQKEIAQQVTTALTAE